MCDPEEAFARAGEILESFDNFWIILVGTVVLTAAGYYQMRAACRNGNATSYSLVNGQIEINAINARPATNNAVDIENQNPS